MKLRHRLALFGALTTAPFLLALPLALRDVSQVFEAELASRLEGGHRAVEAALTDASEQVERAVRDLSVDAAVEDVARTLHGGGDDPSGLIPLGERLMALSGLDVLELLDADGRILTSGHLPARAGDPNPGALRLAGAHPGKAAPQRVELPSGEGIVPGLALLAVRPVDYGTSRIYVAGGRLLGPGWAGRLSELTGAGIAVHDGQVELVRSGEVREPRITEVPVVDGERRLGAIRMELSGAPLREARARLVRNAGLLWLGLLALSALLGWAMAARITRPVDALARGARRLAKGELGHEVQTESSGELKDLVEAFNAMSRDLRTVTERAAVAERVAAWQEVARRLAHEIKNPLTPIRMSMETLVAAHRVGRTDFDEIFAESAQAVLEEVERLKRIVDEFSRFARLPPQRLESVELSELAGTVLSLYATPPEGIRLERELPEGVWVEADRDQLTQVLINLVANASQAMPDGGALTVRVLHDGEGEAALEVEDEGPGIPAELRARIFEPYFSTKERGASGESGAGEGGTGLGLAIAQRIAQEHRGRLEELGTPGRGARFRLTLPRVAAPVEAA